MHLAGVGVARSRHAIMDGLKYVTNEIVMQSLIFDIHIPSPSFFVC
jgi:hypothetical protein